MYIVSNYTWSGQYIFTKGQWTSLPGVPNRAIDISGLLQAHCSAGMQRPYMGQNTTSSVYNPRCMRVHRMLPDFMVPYKQYSEETIAWVLDEAVSCNDLDTEDFPSESTMKRWNQWLIRTYYSPIIKCRTLHLSHSIHTVLPAAHRVEVCKVPSGKAVRNLPRLKNNPLKISFQGHKWNIYQFTYCIKVAFRQRIPCFW